MRPHLPLFAFSLFGLIPVGIAQSAEKAPTIPAHTVPAHTVSVATGVVSPQVGDRSRLAPSIQSVELDRSHPGQTRVRIDGRGFLPTGKVEVLWDGEVLPRTTLVSVRPRSIVLDLPPSPPKVTVQVRTSLGLSGTSVFAVGPLGTLPQIAFVNNRTYTSPLPTAAVWGPDGQLYVTARDGRVTAYEFDETWTITSLVTFDGVSNLTNYDTLGITVNPYDPPGPVKLYVAHGQLFQNGGGSFSGPSLYTGQVSVLTGPNFDNPVPLITQLPCSNHDHGVNGLAFDNNGDLFVSIGGNTNAGVKFPTSGDLPESPFSGCVIKAETSKPGFNGAISYLDTVTQAVNNDQVSGESVDPAPGIDVFVHASGVRNGYGLIYTTSRRLYVSDNGPNFGFGAASTGPNTEDADPYDVDELLYIDGGNYYGHPNRSRGRTDARQNIYRPASTGLSLPDEFTQAIALVSSSSNGLLEYRSDAFGGQMRGDILLQRWFSNTYRIELSADGRRATRVSQLPPFTNALSIIMGPGGTLIGLDYSGSRLRIFEPDDDSAQRGLRAADITPWRTPADGGHLFQLGGHGFGTLADTTVTIGGLPATLTEVTATRIIGLTPTNPNPSTELVDVVVQVGASSDVLADAFRYLPGVGLELGKWEDFPSLLPGPVGEVACGVIDGVLHVVGEGTGGTHKFDLLNRVMLTNGANRPLRGHHHAAEVFGGKLYLIGGLDGGSEGKVQIYDPLTDQWSIGADMPWSGGSVSSALIGGKIYAAGGIVGSATVSNCAVYDPVADSWTSLAPMPVGRNHTASGTDGARFFCFGGRSAGNWVTNGFDDIQIYDPTADAWEANTDPGSSLLPLPEARGGMGKAVYWRGEFYMFGGETLNDPDAVPGTNVYDRVDVYDPVANSWRLEAPMPNPRHGIYPVLFDGHAYIAGGGAQSGYSQSDLVDEFTRQ